LSAASTDSAPLVCKERTVAEEELVETLRYHGLELFGELKYGLVVGDAHLDVHQLADLVLGCLDDLGVAMAGVGNANAAGEVQQLATARGVDETALAPLDDDVGEATPNGGEDGLRILKLSCPVHDVARLLSLLISRSDVWDVKRTLLAKLCLFEVRKVRLTLSGMQTLVGPRVAC
jgi:hypothetical protein